MCGRFANHVQDMHRWVSILKHWPANIEHGEPVAPTGFNIAPTQSVPVVCAAGTYAMRWGLVPSWSKDASPKFATFNARIETVAEKPTFRSAWNAKRRCLVPILGYYEWVQSDDGKQPYFVRQQHGGEILAMAGLWEQRGEMVSFTVLTEPASGKMSELHHRMPVFLNEQNARPWLEGDYEFAPLSHGELRADLSFYPVSKRVNKASEAGASLLDPLSDDGPDYAK